jgi:CRISPR-associated protein Cas2
MNYIISYDIADDKIRLKLFKILKDYGTHVQFSVFEASLNKKQFNKMFQEINSVKINKSTDSIVIYKLNKLTINNKLVIGCFSGDKNKPCYVI